jgi:hypothetical protein
MGSIVRSTGYVELHRPVELAPFIGRNPVYVPFGLLRNAHLEVRQFPF